MRKYLFYIYAAAITLVAIAPSIAHAASANWQYVGDNDNGDSRWYYVPDQITHDTNGFAHGYVRQDKADGTQVVMAMQFDCRNARTRALAEMDAVVATGAITFQSSTPSSWRWVERGTVGYILGNLICK